MKWEVLGFLPLQVRGRNACLREKILLCTPGGRPQAESLFTLTLQKTIFCVTSRMFGTA
jgi:hypothetical protein